MTAKLFGSGLPLLFAGLLLASPAFAEAGGISTGGAVTALEQLREARGEEFRPRYLLVGPGGQAVSHEDFRGRWQLIAFGYTFCPDICPTTLVEMASIMKALGEQAGKLQPLFISVDPERDKPEALKAYTEFFDPRIIGLSGSPALIARAARNFKVRYAKVEQPGDTSGHYAVDHSAGMYLLGPDGSYVRKFAYGQPVEEVVEVLREVLAGRGSGAFRR